MTNIQGVLDYSKRKAELENSNFEIGKWAEVIDERCPDYGAVGKIVEIEQDDDSYNPMVMLDLGYPNYATLFDMEYLKLVPASKIRGFEKISIISRDIPLPERKTSKSAGYDIGVIHPMVYAGLLEGLDIQRAWAAVPKIHGQAIVVKEPDKKSIILPTGIKAYMQNDEYLSMAVRSSAGIKLGIIQANPTSIIDADYYNNPDNEGHIMFAIHNDFIIFDKPIMNIAQGVFLKYLVADNGNNDNERIGGIGSTN